MHIFGSSGFNIHSAVYIALYRDDFFINLIYVMKRHCMLKCIFYQVSPLIFNSTNLKHSLHIMCQLSISSLQKLHYFFMYLSVYWMFLTLRNVTMAATELIYAHKEVKHTTTYCTWASQHNYIHCQYSYI